MSVDGFIRLVDDFAWGPTLIAFSLGCGLLFSISLGFPQIRLFKQMLACSFKTGKSDSGITPFQALSIAIGGRVGTGNITGTASAIMFGGPGAVFWMCVMAIICSASAYIESALAQIWKIKVNDEFAGGPSFYMEKGLHNPFVARFYGMVSIVFLIIFAGVQTNAFSSVASAGFHIPPMAIAICYSLLLVVVIFGGAKVIAGVADKVVPFMSVGYVLVALLLIFINITKVPAMFSLIFSSAFSTNAIYGGLVGSAISWGVRRGVFSNEAGLGTGAWVAGCSNVSHPAKAGLSQTFSVFISLCICLATSLMILVTKSYNVVNPDGSFITSFIEGGGYDVFVTQSINSGITGFGTFFVTLAMFLFTFTTIMAYSMYLSRIYYFFFSNKTSQPIVKLVNKLINIFTICLAFFGPLINSGTIWNLASALCGLLSLVNLLCLAFLFKPGIKSLKDYERQLQKGIDPVFIPEKCGIKGAELWDSIIKEEYAEELKAYKKAFPEEFK